MIACCAAPANRRRLVRGSSNHARAADLLPPLARLVVKAAEPCQLVVVPDARLLVDALAREGSTLVSLEQQIGGDLHTCDATPRLGVAGAVTRPLRQRLSTSYMIANLSGQLTSSQLIKCPKLVGA